MPALAAAVGCTLDLARVQQLPPHCPPPPPSLQEQLPEAKVLYSSATGASEPANLACVSCRGGAVSDDVMQRTLL